MEKFPIPCKIVLLRASILVRISFQGTFHHGYNLTQNCSAYGQICSVESSLVNGAIFQLFYILDVAQNKLFGGIPNCLDNLTALIYGYSNSSSHATYFTVTNYMQETIIVTKGRKLEFDKTLSLINTIDLSGNNLIGGIFLMKLQVLHYWEH